MKIDLKKLEKIVGGNNLSDDSADLYAYSSDASVHQAMPSVIVRPKTTEEVQKIMRYANKNLIPVIPRGAGSSTSGHTVPIDAGIVLDLKRMNRIIKISPQDMLCKVEPGVVDDDLNRSLRPYGLFYPPAPASSKIATIGGEIGANTSGMRSVKYGATRDVVLGMKVVLANGDLVNLGSNTRVHSSGYQLERLIVGSEGTLGVVVEATLKLVPLPKFRCLAMAKFNKLEDAGNAISDIISGGSSPSMLELMDDIGIKAVNKAINLGLPEVAAIILFEADGKVKDAVDYEMETMKRTCEKHNGFGIEMSYDEKERVRIYSGRKNMFASLSRYKEGIICTDLADDMGVPNSKVAECANKIHEIAERNNVIMAVYGHCGSGVVHTKIMMDPKKKSQWDDAKHVVSELYDYVNSIGGVTSAEHGIALSKAPSWKKARRDLLPVMKAIKEALDPNNILNPHKLMDAPDDWVTATNLRYNVGGMMETKYLQNWEQEMNICIRCAYCFEGCPVFKELGWESDGARGKSILSYGLLSGELEPSQHIADKIFQCSFCRDCVERCSAKVSIPDILTAARADLVEAGFVYKDHKELLDKIKRTGNLFGKELKPPIRDGETPVLLGCRFLERADDAKKYLEILEKLGVKPKVVDETCCGMPFGVLGYKKDFEAQQKEFRKRLPYKDFICLCTTCAFFIKNAYPDLNQKYVIEEIAERLPNYELKQLGIKVTYHDPCNLARGMGMVDEPREILKQIGVEVVEMSTNGKQAECCGGGGGLLATDDPLAEKLAENRVNQALDTGVDTLVTLCPTCEYNMRRVADKNNGGLKVKNVLDLVWEALR